MGEVNVSPRLSQAGGEAHTVLSAISGTKIMTQIKQRQMQGDRGRDR